MLKFLRFVAPNPTPDYKAIRAHTLETAFMRIRSTSVQDAEKVQESVTLVAGRLEAFILAGGTSPVEIYRRQRQTRFAVLQLDHVDWPDAHRFADAALAMAEKFNNYVRNGTKEH